MGWDGVRTSWNEADVLDRLMLHQQVDATKYLSPVRVFNSSNVKWRGGARGRGRRISKPLLWGGGAGGGGRPPPATT